MQKFTLRYDAGRVRETNQRLQLVAQGKIPDRVPIFYNTPRQGPPLPKYDLFDDEKDLAYWVDLRQRQWDGFPEGDFYPWVWAGTPFSQAIMASLFGAKITVSESNGMANVEGRVIRDLEKDLPRLPRRVDPETDGMGPRLKKRLQAWAAATDGKIPIMPFDWQTPYGLAGMLMGDAELMVAMYETPELVQDLFDRATQAIIDLIEASQRWLGDPRLCLLNNHMFHPGSGLILHDDYISVLSPALHAKFCHPVNMRLFQKFGLGHLHTCGPVFPGYMDAILRHQGILSIDISRYLRGMTHTREDLLELKRQARAAGVALMGSPDYYTEQKGQQTIVPADRELFNQLAEGGGLVLCFMGGARERGLELLRWGTDCYR